MQQPFRRSGIPPRRIRARRTRPRRAVALASVNVAGGFLVTQRMLEMFKKKPGKGEKR